MQDIHDIAPPVMVGMDPLVWAWAAAVLVLVLLAAGVVFFYRRFRRRNVDVRHEDLLMLPPPPPPDEAALNALAAIRDLAHLDPRAYYFALTATLKTYMGKIFQDHIPEMTTQEVLACLPALELASELKSAVRLFFEAAEMITYAGQAPGRDQAAEDEAFVRRFIHTTRPAAPDPDGGE